MHFNRLALVVSFSLLFVFVAQARVTNAQDAHLENKRDAQAQPEAAGLFGRLSSFFSIFKRQEICIYDIYLQALQNTTLASPLCEALDAYPTITETVEFTPTE